MVECRLRRRLLSLLSTLVSGLLVLSASAVTVSVAQEPGIEDSFAWKKDEVSGKELAASRNEASFNYFDVGDLSYYSQYLVEQDVKMLADAAGMTIEHVPAKHSSIVIVHDSKVFERLRSDKPAFRSLGFSDEMVAMLEQQITSDTPKCLTTTVSDGQNNITGTIVLLSEKFDACLTRALLSYFGSVASDINAKSLIDVCALYEGRRTGLRDRKSLTQESKKLRDLCVAKIFRN
jgi:hypothetical protein